MTEIETTNTSLTVRQTFDAPREAWTDTARKRLNAVISTKDTDLANTGEEST